MTQLAPTNLYASQVIAKLVQFRADYAAGLFADTDEIIDELQTIIGDLANQAHKPITKFEPVVVGEPPMSDKMNRFWKSIQYDVNNISDQLTILRANCLFLHNFYALELEKAKNLNAQAGNKLKTLQLYASTHDPDVIAFGDYFRNQDFIESSLIAAASLVSFDIPGQVSLGRAGEVINLSEDADVKILTTSNGFLGNNQEIEMPAASTTTSTSPQTGSSTITTMTGIPFDYWNNYWSRAAGVLAPASALSDPLPAYTFCAQINRHAELDAIIDEDPTTWIEYESYLVNEPDREKADDLNFVYQKDTSDASQASQTSAPGTNQTQVSPYIDWANGPPSGVLKLDLEFDLKEVKTVNRIAFTPYGLKHNANYPIKVSTVQVSENGTDWTVLNPQNVYLGTDVNLKTADTAANVAINVAEWTFTQLEIQFVRVSIEQNKAVDCNVGHLFYTTSSTGGQPIEIPDLTQPTGVRIVYPDSPATIVRVLGPIPMVDNPAVFYRGNNIVNRGNILQQCEYFKGKRWAIAIRDCLINEVKYQEKSTFISKQFHVNGIVDRVSLEADVIIPDGFDISDTWVKFYVSPNDGINWFQISRIQDDFLEIPEIISFNDPLPLEFRELGVDYHTVPNTVSSLRVKVEITRPSDKPSSSPILRSYVLKVRKR